MSENAPPAVSPTADFSPSRLPISQRPHHLRHAPMSQLRQKSPTRPARGLKRQPRPALLLGSCQTSPVVRRRAPASARPYLLSRHELPTVRRAGRTHALSQVARNTPQCRIACSGNTLRLRAYQPPTLTVVAFLPCHHAETPGHTNRRGGENGLICALAPAAEWWLLHPDGLDACTLMQRRHRTIHRSGPDATRLHIGRE